MQTALVPAAFRRRAIMWALYAFGAIVVLFAASRIPRTVTIFALAAFIAAGVIPLVRGLQRVMPRLVAIALVYAGLVGLLAVLTLLVVPATINELATLGLNLPSFVVGFERTLTQFERTLREHVGRVYLPPGYANLSDFFTSQVASSLSLVVGSLTGVLYWTANALVVAVSALVLSAFFVAQGRGIVESFYASLAPEQRGRARRFGRELGKVFVGFVAGQTLLCAVAGIAIFALSAVFGFRFAFLLGIFCGLAYAVPFVGAVASQLVAALLAVPQGGSMVVAVSVIVFVIGRICDTLLVPKVMSDRVGVSPIVVMFAVFAGGELFGVAGLVLGIPAAALLNVAWKFSQGAYDALDEAPASSMPVVEGSSAVGQAVTAGPAGDARPVDVVA